MVDIFAEGALGPAAAARWLNSHIEGANYRPIAVWRLMKKGSVAADGHRIFLEHIKLGRKFFTSAPALGRLAARLAAVGPTASHTASTATPKEELVASGFFR